jgi:hypothetical protein
MKLSFAQRLSSGPQHASLVTFIHGGKKRFALFKEMFIDLTHTDFYTGNGQCRPPNWPARGIRSGMGSRFQPSLQTGARPDPYCSVVRIRSQSPSQIHQSRPEKVSRTTADRAAAQERRYALELYVALLRLRRPHATGQRSPSAIANDLRIAAGPAQTRT